MIAAMSTNRVIGINNQLPWHMPADLKHFKSLTINKPVVMGRKTYESIGKPLPNRQNIIVTKQANYRASGCDVVNSIDAAINAAEAKHEIMIIGGANLFEQCLPLAKRLYLTVIETNIAGDTFFPNWNKEEWTITSRESHQPDDKNQHPYCFMQVDREAS